MYEPILPAKGVTAVRNPWLGLEVAWGWLGGGVMCGFWHGLQPGLHLCCNYPLELSVLYCGTNADEAGTPGHPQHPCDLLRCLAGRTPVCVCGTAGVRAGSRTGSARDSGAGPGRAG